MPDAARAQRRQVKVVIADASWLIRDSIARLLAELDATCIIHTAPDGTVLHNVLRTNPDLTLVLVGRALVGDEEEPLFRHIQKLAPKAVIALVGHAFEHESIRKAVYFGALGLISTGDPRDGVSSALRTLLSGEVALPAPAPIVAPAAPPAEPGNDLGVLTPRERDVFALLGEGLSVLLVAENLRLSPHTIRVHIARIMKKLDLRDRSALMHRAVSQLAPLTRRQKPIRGQHL